MQVEEAWLFWDVKALIYKLADRIEKLRLMDECNVFVLDCGCRWVLTEKQKRTIESLIQIEQKDPKEKSANDSAECSLKGSAASAHAKMMNATSVSHASRGVDSDMQRLCLCRSCGGWIIFPRSSFPAGQPTEKPCEGHDPYGVEPSHSSAGPAETSF